MRTGPDWELRWPTSLFVAEAITILNNPPPGSRNWADAARFLLEDAFASSVPRDSIPETPQPGTDAHQVLTDILTIADTFRQVEERQPYFLERGQSALRGPLAREAAQREFARLVSEFYGRGYFARDLYPGCVDDHEERPADVSSFLEEQLGVPDLWPLRSSIPWADEVWYSLIEVFHDHAARPRSRWYHSWNGCGFHYSDFAAGPGQSLYRWTLNRLLDRAHVPYRLSDSGEDVGRLVLLTDEARTDLVQRLVDGHADVGNDPVAHSMSLFRRRGATKEDKRSAIVALAGILEERRLLIKAELLARDESSLFDIANNYSLRHRNELQKDQYGDEFFDWIFWLFASTVELTDRLVNRNGS